MKSINFAKTVVAGAALAVVLATFVTTKGRADSPGGQGPAGESEQQEIQIGLSIAPVPLNPIGKDMNLVGLGSFLVNAVGDCNGCHTGSPSGTEYTTAGNPYLIRVPLGPFTGKSQIDPKYYLAGGQDFGPLCPGVGNPIPAFAGCAPDLVTRNLTPNLVRATRGRPFPFRFSEHHSERHGL